MTAVSAGSLVALLAVTFLIGTWTGKHNVMDVARGAGIIVALRGVPAASGDLVSGVPVGPGRDGAASTGQRDHCRWLRLLLIGFFFEVAGDWRLAKNRDDPANRRRILDRGLWRYTRYPRQSRRVLPDGYRDRRHDTRPARPRQPSACAGVRRRPAGRAGVRG
ncbi:MAG TPA: DUF1295 domain-containing protein [Trebonia sp.]|jgi:hypothetical protein